jgi:hypothetical protein
MPPRHAQECRDSYSLFRSGFRPLIRLSDFTFDGEVCYIYDRYGTNVPGDAGLSRGSPLTYTFLVDFEAEGYYWSRVQISAARSFL